MVGHADFLDVVRIDLSALPETEHEAATTVEQSLMHMQSAVTEFRQSVNLYLMAHERKLALGAAWDDRVRELISWMKMAGRNGAIVTYGIEAAIEEINSVRAPTLWSRVDIETRKRAQKRLKDEFPTISGIRHSAAHPGELSNNPNDLAKHQMQGSPVSWMASAGKVFMQGCMRAYGDGMEFTATFEGKPVSYILSHAKADALAGAVSEYTSAFTR